MYGSGPVGVEHIDALIRHAPSIVMGTFRLGLRPLAEPVPEADILRALGSFGDLVRVEIDPAHHTARCRDFLVANGYMYELGFCQVRQGNYVSDWWLHQDTSVSEASLLRFSFGECEDRYATRERRLRISVPKLSPSFLQQWIEVGLT